MTAYFVFEQCTTDGDLVEFVFKLVDRNKISEARSILASGSPKHRVNGTIVKQPAPYNPQWPFHLDPATIGFFEFSIEVCDANVQHVTENLDHVGGDFLPNGFWCPWSSRLSAEITATIDPKTEMLRTGP